VSGLKRALDRLAHWLPAPGDARLIPAADLAAADLDLPPAGEALRRLLEALEREADLSAFGRLSTRRDLRRLLRLRRRLHETLRRAPESERQTLAAPIFITGLPRSGSTFLHRLLAQDPAQRVVRHFEALDPLAPNDGPDLRRVRTRAQLAFIERLAPELAGLHPLTSDTPQECTELFAASFRSLRFDTTYDIPSYRAWLDRAGSRDAYRFHRRVLGVLQARAATAPRWVLKSPDHVFSLDDLLAEYPDARLIFTHRDPLQVIPSVVRLTAALRGMFAEAIDVAALAREQLARWSEGGQRLARARATASASGTVLHLEYRELVTDPLDAVRRIYAHFGLPLEPAARAAMAAYVAAHPDGDYRSHAHDLERYGLSAAEVARAFEDYLDAYAPEREHAAWRRRRAPDRRGVPQGRV